MNVVVDSAGPPVAVIAGNPVPPGARFGYFTTSDNIRLRFGLFQRAEGTPMRGTICLVQGRTEFIEKYFETITDFQKRGFAVATFDFRGQGGSDRLIPNRHLGYVDRFEDYWTDLRSFHGDILLPDCPPPFYLVAHSMGGLVALDAGRRDRLMFDRIFLSAPMVGLDNQPFGMAGMSRLTNMLCFLGLGRLPIARRQDRAPTEASFADNALTSDRTRFLRSVEVMQALPDLEIGAPTIRWSAAATSAMSETLRDRFPGSIKIPVLMLAAARDRVVSSSATEQLGLRMRTGRHIVIPGAQHELFMETDAIRAQVFAAFDAFITEQSER